MRFSPVMLLAARMLVLVDRMHRHEQEHTLEDVDILAAVDTDEPFANALFVPVSAGIN
jgi:hypothetical protein